MQDGTAQGRIRRLSNFANNNGLPVGFEYFTINKNIRLGSLPLLGGAYSRTAYADLWSWVQEQPGYLITETEWQEKFQANNGNVPFYSSGDGTSTFRVPSLKCWVKGANGIEEVGSYLEAGLPNITGTFRSYAADGQTNSISWGTMTGAFYHDGNSWGWYNTGSDETSGNPTGKFDASRSNAIYGKSEEVQPESIVGLYCVVAFGTVTNTGNLDIQTFINQFEQMKEQWSKAVQTIDYSREKLFTPNKTSITVHAGTQVVINEQLYTVDNDTTLQLSTAGQPSALAGKDVYIYACQPTDVSSTQPVLVLSLNSTVPTGYSADNSRKIGGFHCLCLDVGTISGHTLSGYVTGDILPASVWDLIHRPKCKQGGMIYLDVTDTWHTIYGLSWDGTNLVSVYQGIWADGTSAKKWHGEATLEQLERQNMRLDWRHEFQMYAKGSNEQTNIQGSSDPNTTGGHKDTAGRRMISNYGAEDCCGVLWQWTMDLGFAGGSGWNDSVYNNQVDDRSYGKSYGTLYRLLVGGHWANSSGCGSRSVDCDASSAYVHAIHGARGASEPMYRNALNRKSL